MFSRSNDKRIIYKYPKERNLKFIGFNNHKLWEDEEFNCVTDLPETINHEYQFIFDMHQEKPIHLHEFGEPINWNSFFDSLKEIVYHDDLD